MSATSEARWAARRALYECGAPTQALIAKASNCSEAALARRAKAENWIAASRCANHNERLEALRDHLISLAEEMRARGAGEVEALDKAKLDAIASVIRTIEKIDDITRSGGGAKENQIRQDADMAAILSRIDQRIVELAMAYAERLGRAKSNG